VSVQLRPHPVTRGHRPAIRLRAAPRFDPPFDDQLGSEVWLRSASADQLMFDFPAPGSGVDVRDAGAAAAAGGPPGAAPTVAAPTVATPPEARRAAHRFANTCVEIFNGFRPTGHVRPLARPHTSERLVQQLGDALGRLPAVPPRRGALAGGRRPDLLRLRMLRVSAPTDGVVEAAAAVGNSARTWALAFRLERRSDDAWLGTVAHLL
jgi:uncharacterized protein DUF6459